METLISSHNTLAQEMASIGDGLILPGDPDWVDPPSGKDDWEMVKQGLLTELVLPVLFGLRFGTTHHPMQDT